MIKWGIIGCGHIAGKFAEDLALVEGSELYAVASRSKDKASQFAKKYSATKSYGDYEKICIDDQVDIIYLATPHNSHMELGLIVMNHGKHLLCEKPIAINTQQLNRLIDCAQENKVFMMEALWARFNPSIVEALELVQSGEIGNVSYINADFNFTRAFDVSHRLFNIDLAGGALLDIGIYPLFLSYLILGKPDEIVSRSRLHSTGIDMQTSAILMYDNAQAILSFGFQNDAPMVGRINGDQGSINLHSRWHETQGYSIIKNKQEEIHQRPTFGFGYTYEIMECMRCITSHKLESDKWTHQNSLDLMSMLDEVRKQNGVIYPSENI